MDRLKRRVRRGWRPSNPLHGAAREGSEITRTYLARLRPIRRPIGDGDRADWVAAQGLGEERLLDCLRQFLALGARSAI